MGSQALRTAEAALLEAVGCLLVRHGFKPRPRGQTFERNTEFGCWRLHLSIVRGGELAEITASAALRVNAVEDLVNSADVSLSKKLAKETSTAGAELGNLRDGRPIVWYLHADDPVEGVAHQIVSVFTEIGLPYLDELSNLDTLLARLAESGDRAWLVSPLPDARFKRAVALAVVLARMETAKEIAESSERFLAQRNDPRLLAFRHFCGQIVGKSS